MEQCGLEKAGRRQRSRHRLAGGCTALVRGGAGTVCTERAVWERNQGRWLLTEFEDSEEMVWEGRCPGFWLIRPGG